MNMNVFLNFLGWFLLIPTQLLVSYLFKRNPEWVEENYSEFFYYYSSTALHKLLGAVPFSVGDVLYIVVSILLLVKLINIIKTSSNPWTKISRTTLYVVKVFLVFFFLFNLFWGFNNYRTPLSDQLHLKMEYKESDLVALTEQLINQVNYQQIILTADSLQPVTIPYDIPRILQDANDGISNFNQKHQLRTGQNLVAKRSLWSLPLSYMGFSGYINPFTNEAQINDRIPKIGMVITASHEMAHQMGIAKESEANLVGYLASLEHPDLFYNYSASLYALRYCLATLERSNYPFLDRLYNQIQPGAQTNLMENPLFWNTYKGASTRFFKVFYGNFLKATNQKEGIYSYNKFIDLLINYHKRFPLES